MALVHEAVMESCKSFSGQGRDAPRRYQQNIFSIHPAGNTDSILYIQYNVADCFPF